RESPSSRMECYEQAERYGYGGYGGGRYGGGYGSGRGQPVGQGVERSHDDNRNQPR
uniref:Glycine-rich antimicrobial peptide Pg-AMP n=1 Tax=Psidium guajava TaxID=120290 RepID=GRP1_PSIGU|nr:RecName: Full=Glycine-rich antimicrobial peptide Pg-AMP [Psidium guajava]